MTFLLPPGIKVKLFKAFFLPIGNNYFPLPSRSILQTSILPFTTMSSKSYRNQPIDLQLKSIGWFLYDGNIDVKPSNYSVNSKEKVHVINSAFSCDVCYHYNQVIKNNYFKNEILSVFPLIYFLLTWHIYTSRKHQKTLRFSDVFRVYRNLTIGKMG